MLPSFFHQPVAISAAFAFVPFVPIMTVAIVVTMMFIGEARRWSQEYGSQRERSKEFLHCESPPLPG